MSRKALLIDYEYCCGCHTCEVACQRENGYAPGVWGIQCKEVGPYRYDDLGAVIYDIVPIPTDLCTLCSDRVAAGELPTCVKHCQTGCIKFGDVATFASELERKPKQVLFTR